MKNITIIGCGNLGMAIAHGLLDSKDQRPSSLHLSRRKVEKLAALERKGAVVHTDNREAIADSEIIILAVKPYNIEKIVNELNPLLDGRMLVSLASGVDIASVREAIEGSAAIIRVMPNIAAEFNNSMSLISGPDASEEQRAAVQAVFETIGRTEFIEEQLMEAATVLGACGIAYVMRFMRAMIQGGVQIGFDAATASRIVTQTVLGASTMLIEGETHPEAEIDKVTTPKGCTIVGLNEMEHHGFSSSLIKGIVKSYESI